MKNLLSNYSCLYRYAGSALCLLLVACGGGGSSSGGGAGPATPPPVNNPPLASAAVESDLSAMVADLELTGDPATPRGLAQIVPDEDAMVKLGQILFFSQTLSGAYDVSCGTCHHPDFGMGDNLSLGVGVVPENRSAVGLGRVVESARDRDPSADGGPNMFRNSLTTMNTAFHDRVLLLDGRIQVIDTNHVFGGHGQSINTPESGATRDVDEVSGLLEFQAKGPMATDNEMRGFLYTEYATGSEYREHLVKRLKGEVDTVNNTTVDAAANWLALFRDAFGDPDGLADDLITMLNIQHALAKYSESQIFIDSPWKAYLDGATTEISDEAKNGALLFYRTEEEGGLGCASCHEGDRFTDEKFHNVGFPQIGRGFGRTDTTDQGRWLETRGDDDYNAFRTLSLLNITETGPYGHSGAFSDLEELLRYHADPETYINTFDFSLSTLPQFAGSNVSYPDAELNTRFAMAQASFSAALELLPQRQLSSLEIDHLMAFMESLTDTCVADPACIGQWGPGLDEDPDGHLLVRDASLSPTVVIDGDSADSYPSALPVSSTGVSSRTTFADATGCNISPVNNVNTGALEFQHMSDPGFGLTIPHGYSRETWFKSQMWVEVALIGGGVTSAYINDDCWPDLVFTSGENAGMVFYENNGGTGFTAANSFLTGLPEMEFSGSAVADLNGDYRREIMFGNVVGTEIPVYGQNPGGLYELVAAIPMVRPTFGISFAPLDDSGYPYFYLAHWNGGSGVNGASPSLWRNEGNVLKPWDVEARTTGDDISQSFNFTPKFFDFTGDDKLDLVIASDFFTSSTLRNVSVNGDSPLFVDETDKTVINDQNGMGSTILDIDNDGNMEWLVTSIYAEDSTNVVVEETDMGPIETVIPTNWGDSGNRLYRNVSTSNEIAFENITDQAGLRVGYWGWGACAADFNNDGFTDIYQVNGYGYMPSHLPELTWQYDKKSDLEQITDELFQGRAGLLYINNGDGTFDNEATSWSLNVASEGRGLSCFDFDRDGDEDIVVFDHSTGLQFFENQSGSAAGRKFIDIRTVGTSPNTDAIGAKVTVTANLGGTAGIQTQTKHREANSSFNSQTIPNLHFGLGQASVIDEIRIEWFGSDETTVCSAVPVNQFLVIDQRDGNAACP